MYFFLQHTTRNFYNEHGDLRYADSGFYFVEWDRHSKKTIEKMCKPSRPLHYSEVCGDEAFCGLPLLNTQAIDRRYYSKIVLINTSLSFYFISSFRGQWLPSTNPKISEMSEIVSHTKLNTSDGNVIYSITTNGGTSLRVMYIRPRGTAKVVSWSFTDQLPDVYQNGTYFISVANGVDKDNYNFQITLRSVEKQDEPLLDITLVSVKYDSKSDYTQVYKILLNRVPDWAAAVDGLAAVTGYTI